MTFLIAIYLFLIGFSDCYSAITPQKGSDTPRSFFDYLSKKPEPKKKQNDGQQPKLSTSVTKETSLAKPQESPIAKKAVSPQIAGSKKVQQADSKLKSPASKSDQELQAHKSAVVKQFLAVAKRMREEKEGALPKDNSAALSDRKDMFSQADLLVLFQELEKMNEKKIKMNERAIYSYLAMLGKMLATVSISYATFKAHDIPEVDGVSQGFPFKALGLSIASSLFVMAVGDAVYYKFMEEPDEPTFVTLVDGFFSKFGRNVLVLPLTIVCALFSKGATSYLGKIANNFSDAVMVGNRALRKIDDIEDTIANLLASQKVRTSLTGLVQDALTQEQTKQILEGLSKDLVIILQKELKNEATKTALKELIEDSLKDLFELDKDIRKNPLFKTSLKDDLLDLLVELIVGEEKALDGKFKRLEARFGVIKEALDAAEISDDYQQKCNRLLEVNDQAFIAKLKKSILADNNSEDSNPDKLNAFITAQKEFYSVDAIQEFRQHVDAKKEKIRQIKREHPGAEFKGLAQDPAVREEIKGIGPAVAGGLKDRAFGGVKGAAIWVGGLFKGNGAANTHENDGSAESPSP